MGKVDIEASIDEEGHPIVGKVSDETVDSERNSTFERRPLTTVFHCATAKVLDFLSMYREFDYAVTDVAKGSGLNLKTASKELENLTNLGLVKFTRKVGRSDMYRLNDTGPSRYLLNFVNERIIENLEGLRRSNLEHSAESQ